MSETTEAEQLARLPKWAQSRIQILERQLADARRDLEHAIGTEKSSIEIDAHRAYERDTKHMFVNNHATIRFTLPDGEVDVRIRDKRVVEIMTSEFGGHDMTIQPRAANCLWVGFHPTRRG